MLAPLRNRVFRRLFAAQVIALTGTGLLTVALGLLAYELAGGEAGAVLGTALAIKMVAYILVAPLAGAVSALLPRRSLLIGLDLVRAGAAIYLPFVDQIWQIYVLIFLLQSASGAFTPTFQAVIPDILRHEQDYTKALSLSRLAYDLEALLSPMLAAALLTVMSFHSLFAGTAFGFLASAAFVFLTVLPPRLPSQQKRFSERLLRGVRIYLLTPRLRGLLALNLAAAASGAIVIVNTVVIVRDMPGLGDQDVAITLAAFGFGSMAMAFALPSVLEKFPDRSVMLSAALLITVPMLAAAFALGQGSEAVAWPAILMFWPLLGAGYAAIVTPAGRLLRRSVHEEDRPDVFAAQFALSHACWLIAYPSAGWLGPVIGLPATIGVHAALALFAAFLAIGLWPAGDPMILAHSHPELSASHPHLREHGRARHAHVFVIDDLHQRWPK